MRRVAIVLGVILAAIPCGLYAGGELPNSETPKRQHSRMPRFGGTIPKKTVGRITGRVAKEEPLPAPSRSIGWGINCNEFYGPTYYYPKYHNEYESLNPSYYPFFHPRYWPNYKADGDYCPGSHCGSSRSFYYWDSYDDWVRGARYEEHQ